MEVNTAEVLIHVWKEVREMVFDRLVNFAYPIVLPPYMGERTMGFFKVATYIHPYCLFCCQLKFF